jgi:cardiolipin synthase
MLTLSQLPNLITLSRIALVPALILVLKDQDYVMALVIFLVAGISDALDGFIAKRFGFTSHLGAVLDPVADKMLLVGAYVMLTILGQLPFWLVLTVVFRDLLIVGGYLVYTSLHGAVQMQPTLLSKFNTLAQIGLVVAILVHEAMRWALPAVIEGMTWLVLVTTVTSGAHYVWVWGVKKHGTEAARHE